ncbi:hypothetical protein Vafri_18955, partial [Volvox africanus]
VAAVARAARRPTPGNLRERAPGGPAGHSLPVIVPPSPSPSPLAPSWSRAPAGPTSTNGQSPTAAAAAAVVPARVVVAATLHVRSRVAAQAFSVATRRINVS